jgi:hypothetical protein
MSLGNAGGVSVEIDGQALAPLGQAGEVRRDIPLDAVSLRQSYLAPDPAVKAPAAPETAGETPAASPGPNSATE